MKFIKLYILLSLIFFFSLDIQSAIQSANVWKKDHSIYISNPQPTFEWDLISEAVNYRLQLSGTESFQTIYWEISTTMREATLPPEKLLILEDRYYYRVITYADNNASAVSDSKYFIFDKSPPVIDFSKSQVLNLKVSETDTVPLSIFIEDNFKLASVMLNNETIPVIDISEPHLYRADIDLILEKGSNYFVIEMYDAASNYDSFTFNILHYSNYINADNKFIPDSPSTASTVSVNLSDTTQYVILHKTTENKIGVLFEISGIGDDTGILEFIIDLYPDNSVADTIYQPDNILFGFKFDKNIYSGDTTYLVEPVFIFDINPMQFIDFGYYHPGNLEIFIKKYSLKYYFKNEIIKPENYGLYYLNSFDSKWYSVCDASQPGGIIAKENYYITGENYIGNNIKHFSTFALSKKRLKLSQKTDKIVIYPNPFVPNDNNSSTGRMWDGTPGSGIVIGIDSSNDGFIDSSFDEDFIITIYNIIGERIKTYLRRIEYGIYIWDGKTDAGLDAASGLYFAVIEYKGIKTVKKIAIVR